ncbi:MAG: hypothetical protein ACKO6N_13260 [Myxococcota bacterium]
MHSSSNSGARSGSNHQDEQAFLPSTPVGSENMELVTHVSASSTRLPLWPFLLTLGVLLLTWYVTGTLGLLNEKLLPRLDAVL